MRVGRYRGSSVGPSDSRLYAIQSRESWYRHTRRQYQTWPAGAVCVPETAHAHIMMAIGRYVSPGLESRVLGLGSGVWGLGSGILALGSRV
eukprot:832319-Rhodomonas_salina.7